MGGFWASAPHSGFDGCGVDWRAWSGEGGCPRKQRGRTLGAGQLEGMYTDPFYRRKLGLGELQKISRGIIVSRELC